MTDLAGYETTEDTRLRLGLKNRRTVQIWCENGKLPCVKMGRMWLVEKDAEPDVIRRPGARKEKG